MPCGSGHCFLTFAGTPQSINSIVLKTNGISFALQSALFLFIGSFADYGRWRPWILISWTVVSWGVGFGWLGVHDASKWQAGTALYILGCNINFRVSDCSNWVPTCFDLLDSSISAIGKGYAWIANCCNGFEGREYEWRRVLKSRFAPTKSTCERCILRLLMRRGNVLNCLAEKDCYPRDCCWHYSWNRNQYWFFQ